MKELYIITDNNNTPVEIIPHDYEFSVDVEIRTLDEVKVYSSFDKAKQEADYASDWIKGSSGLVAPLKVVKIKSYREIME